MVMITLGTGVGSGIILDGKVWHGMFGMGGEVGHTTVDPLESYAVAAVAVAWNVRFSQRPSASHRALADSVVGTAALRNLSPVRRLHSSSGGRLAETGDHAARLAFERLGTYLGIGLANLINTLDVP